MIDDFVRAIGWQPRHVLTDWAAIDRFLDEFLQEACASATPA
jgi:hypothetical protein